MLCVHCLHEFIIQTVFNILNLIVIAVRDKNKCPIRVRLFKGLFEAFLVPLGQKSSHFGYIFMIKKS